MVLDKGVNEIGVEAGDDTGGIGVEAGEDTGGIGVEAGEDAGGSAKQSTFNLNRI